MSQQDIETELMNTTIQELWDKGMGIEEVANELGIEIQTVWDYIAGIEQ